MIQYTSWGHIDWKYISEPGDPGSSMSVGFTNIDVGKYEPTHIHYGHEQFLYVLQGTGINVINGEEFPFSPGMEFYMKSDTTHKEINTGSVPIREILIANPVAYTYDAGKRDEGTEHAAGKSTALYDAVEAMRYPLLESVKMPFVIFDTVGSVVMQGQRFPKFCVDHCDPVEHPERCACFTYPALSRAGSMEKDYTCPYGLSVNYTPIVFNGKDIGTICGGYYYSSEDADIDLNELKDCYDQPKSAQIGMRKLQKQMVDSILSYCAFRESREKLKDKEVSLRDIRLENDGLEQDLGIMKDTVTDLKIEHHFLFNTLNCMASMALEGDRDDLYQAIINLSNMFRYTMVTELRFVDLDSELKYLETYLDLQKLRYGDALHVEYDIDKQCHSMMVPFNLLQPVVENAFTHGFMSSDEKKEIVITVREEDGRCVIIISNNGVTPDDITINRVRKSLSSGSGHGMSLIYDKLQSAYGGDFVMDISAREVGGAEITVRIPSSFEKGEQP